MRLLKKGLFVVPVKKAALIWRAGRRMRQQPINNEGGGGFTTGRNVTGVSVRALKEFMDRFIKRAGDRGGVWGALIKNPALAGQRGLFSQGILLTHTHTNNHTYITNTQNHTHTHIHKHMQSHTYMHICNHTNTHTQTTAHAHTQPLTCTHSHNHTNSHTHTHTSTHANTHYGVFRLHSYNWAY